MFPLLYPLFAFALVHLVRGAIYERFEDVPQDSVFDFVIVGGGTAGNALANRLTENPNFNVLVLEAGPSNEDVLDSIVPFFCAEMVPFTPWDWNYTTTPQEGLNGRSVVYPRGHILGGTSSVNFMAYLRGSSEDWDRYAAITGDEGWSWDAIQPYIRRNEKWTEPADHHNTTGQFNPKLHSKTGINSVSLAGFPRLNLEPRVIQTTRDLPDEFPFNEDMNSGNHLGVGWTQATINGGRRSSSATSYLGPDFIRRRNLHVLVNARVTRLLKTGTTRDGELEILAVEFVNGSNASHITTVQAQKEVILSAGSVNTPQILQLSGIGDRGLLSSLGIPVILNNPSVGRNLSDHPLLPNNWLVNSNDTFEAAERNATLADEQLAEWKATEQGPLVDTLLDHLAWLRIPDNETDIWDQFEDPAAGKNTAHYELLFANGIIPGTFPLPATGNFLSVITAIVSPTSRGSVMVNTSDPFAAPLINPGLLQTDFDFEAMKFSIRSAQRFLQGPAWSDYIISALDGANNTTMVGTDEELGEYVRANTATIFHPVGTAAMSPKGANWGVVDPDLKVKGISGLRVVDASVLPIVPAAHTQVPSYIVGERAADLVKRAWVDDPCVNDSYVIYLLFDRSRLFCRYTGPPFDFVIVTVLFIPSLYLFPSHTLGGTAVNTLANLLTENPNFNVLVLEAGPSNEGVLNCKIPFYYTKASPITPWGWNYTTTAQEGLNGRSRGHVLGGSSSINTMAYLRGSPEDWDCYASITGDERFVFIILSIGANAECSQSTHNEKWTEPADCHNTAGQYTPEVHSMTDINSVSLAGYPRPNLDPRIIQTTKDIPDEFLFNEDMNSGDRLVNAHVTRLVKAGTAADGAPDILAVEFVNSVNTSDTLTIHARKEVIFSAGSVDTSQLLQLSGIGDKTHLSSLNIPVLLDHRSVGQNLSDHLLVPNIWVVNSNDTFVTAGRDVTLATEQLAEWQALVDTSLDHLGWLRIPDNGTDIWDRFEDTTAGKHTAHYELVFAGGIIPGRGALPPRGNFFSLATAIVTPVSRGSVMVNTSDPFAAPLIDPLPFVVRKYSLPDLYIISPFIRDNKTTMTGTEEELGECVRVNSATVFYPVGTASMSLRGADWEVGDPDIRVKGVSELRVVDASVLPVAPAAHTQGPVCVVAERAVDLVKGAWGALRATA
ncbi:Choline dehydrogenase, mitochondrial [Leucoagaricus sp. SymC.cos]|nr:Choline dehydrogenase, mitochondrial [Leucoagaricus sp. SymC.cos]